MSTIRDQSLASEGKLKIDWVKEHMPVLQELEKEYSQIQPFRGLRVAICLHLEAKTAYMALVLQKGGAEVFITGSNPLSTQDAVAAALVREGIEVNAWYNASDKEYHAHLRQTVKSSPNLIIDDGGDLVTMLHQDYPDLIPEVIGGSEETTTGLIRLRAMEKDGILSFPMIAVNDAFCKYLFDNRYGTGQSVWDGIMRTTNLVIAGKVVVVIGYGWCGKGVAMRAQGLGARVVVTEVDPISALEAHMDGFQVMPVKDAASLGDIFVTVTGCRDALGGEVIANMKDKAIMSNAGHFDVEIDKKYLEKISVEKREVRPNILEYMLSDGRRLYLLAEGRLVNLAAGDGHPAEIMDLSFALQALALRYLLDNRGKFPPKVLNLPAETNDQVARLKLKGIGLTIDELTKSQRLYLESWNIG